MEPRRNDGPTNIDGRDATVIGGRPFFRALSIEVEARLLRESPHLSMPPGPRSSVEVLLSKMTAAALTRERLDCPICERLSPVARDLDLKRIAPDDVFNGLALNGPIGSQLRARGVAKIEEARQIALLREHLRHKLAHSVRHDKKQGGQVVQHIETAANIELLRRQRAWYKDAIKEQDQAIAAVKSLAPRVMQAEKAWAEQQKPFFPGEKLEGAALERVVRISRAVRELVAAVNDFSNARAERVELRSRAIAFASEFGLQLATPYEAGRWVSTHVETALRVLVADALKQAGASAFMRSLFNV